MTAPDEFELAAGKIVDAVWPDSSTFRSFLNPEQAHFLIAQALREADARGEKRGEAKGRAQGLEDAAGIADEERKEYVKSMEEFDKRDDVRMGTNEARCSVTAQFIRDTIRAKAKALRGKG
ncbi:MAG: hypothetical protein ACXWPM_04380 [Bdellovibrionota bacterium]